MSCQVIITDYVAEQQLIYWLEDADFADCETHPIPTIVMAHRMILDRLATETVAELAVALCHLIRAVQHASGSVIDLLRVARVTIGDLRYEYNARLDLALTGGQP